MTDFLQTQQANVEARFAVGDRVTIKLHSGRGSRKIGKEATILRLAPEGFLTVEGKNGQEVQVEARCCTPMSAAAPARFRKGDRVVPSSVGRTASWPKTPGTVTRKLSKTSVEVVWDGTSFGDEMELTEIVSVIDAALGAQRFDDAAAEAAGIRLFEVTRNGRTVKVSVPEND